jgi:diguanylate cyclase (GGDEF)-like protein/PAS domain S-box-containing protein
MPYARLMVSHSTHLSMPGFQRFARGTAALVLLIGSFALMGQLPAITTPVYVVPEFGTVKATTTLLVLLSGLGLWLATGRQVPFRRRYARACAVLVAGAGTLALLGALHAAGAVWTGGTIGSWVDAAGRVFGGPLPLNGALAFIMLGAALLLLDVETRKGRRPSQLLALSVIVSSLVAIIGYAYDAAPFYRLPGSPPLPLYAAVSFCALGIGILAASPDGRLLRMVTSDSAGGRVVRFLPAALVAGPLVFGWLTLELQRARVWDATLTLSVFVLLNTGLLALVIMAVAVSIDRAETRRRRAEHSARVKAAHQTGVAKLGQRALAAPDLGRLLTEAAALVAETLDVDACEILEQAADLLILRAAAGWPDRDLHADLGTAARHPLGSYAYANGVPVVVDDFGRDARFPPIRPERLVPMTGAAAVIIAETQSRAFGVLAVYTRRVRTFGRDDVHFLQTVATLLGSAIDRSRTEDALRQSEAKFANVFRSCPDSIALTSVETGRYVDVNASFLKLTGYPREAVVGHSSADLGMTLRPADREALIQAARSGRGSDGTEVEFRTRLGDVRTSLCFTEIITLGGEECLLTLARDISDRKRVEAMAAEANEHLRRSVAELERQTREISLLNDMSDLLQSCLTVSEASTIVMQFAQQLFPDAAGALCLVNDTGTLIEAAGTWGGLSPEECLFRPTDCWALRRGRPHVVTHTSGAAEPWENHAALDQSAGLQCPHLGTYTSGSFVCVPMMAQNETLGLLHVRGPDRDDAGRGRPLSSDAGRRLAVTLAEHVALAIANLKLRDTLRRQSIRDQLTGLLNRRYMEEALERELRRASRGQAPLSLVMLDVDRLKQVNDRFGHEAGDTLLKTVSEFLQRRTREEDIVCRLGGDEFVLVMPGASLADAQERAEQLLTEVRRVTIAFPGEQDFVPSLSMGLAVYPAHASTVQTLLRAADLALYRAKAEGRDRLTVGHTVD